MGAPVDVLRFQESHYESQPVYGRSSRATNRGSGRVAVPQGAPIVSLAPGVVVILTYTRTGEDTPQQR